MTFRNVIRLFFHKLVIYCRIYKRRRIWFIQVYVFCRYFMLFKQMQILHLQPSQVRRSSLNVVQNHPASATLQPLHRCRPLCVQVIERYLQSTHAPTHCDYTMKVLDMFSVDRVGESDNFLSNLHNRWVEPEPLVNFAPLIGFRSDSFSQEEISVEVNARLCFFTRTLLWHGSRLSNWVGILSKGLRVAPPEAPVTGYMV